MCSYNIDIIGKLLHYSKWVSPDSNNCFEFRNEKVILLNNKILAFYSLKQSNGKILIQIDKTIYTVDYINDFTLRLYNTDDSFIITPE